MANSKGQLTCLECQQQYAVEDSDAAAVTSYCSAECEADAGDEDDADNLINRIERAISSDDDSPGRNSERIVERYEAATEAERAVVDDIFTSLCGWTLKTLIEGKERQ